MLGTLLAETGLLELGLMHLQSAARHMPASPMIHTNIGHVQMKLGQLDLAINSYQNALKLKPHSPEILFNMGAIFHEQGKMEDAASYIDQSLELRPDFPIAYPLLSKIQRELGHPELAAACLIKLLEYTPRSINTLFELGNLLAAYHDYSNAAIYFKRILDIDPLNGSAHHALAALSGETTVTAPRKHVEDIFDGLSENFDRHLRELGYRTPELLTEMLIDLVGDQFRFDRAIDLGCGTGLSGAPIRPISTHLSGLDVSQKMVEIARSKNIYDELYRDDINQHLKSSQQQYDLFIAEDVFIYIGELTGVFKSIKAHAKPDAYFIFSTELATEQDYILRPTGRYAHSRNYIETLSNKFGFTIAASKITDLRMEAMQAIKGELFVLKLVSDN
jgi:predicted TPR repeat methyltransferase